MSIDLTAEYADYSITDIISEIHNLMYENKDDGYDLIKTIDTEVIGLLSVLKSRAFDNDDSY